MNYECKKNKAAKNVLILTMFESITEHGRAERRRRTQSDIQFECLTFARGKIFRQANCFCRMKNVWLWMFWQRGAAVIIPQLLFWNEASKRNQWLSGKADENGGEKTQSYRRKSEGVGCSCARLSEKRWMKSLKLKRQRGSQTSIVHKDHSEKPNSLTVGRINVGVLCSAKLCAYYITTSGGGEDARRMCVCRARDRWLRLSLNICKCETTKYF